jgi:hypothetical protein
MPTLLRRGFCISSRQEDEALAGGANARTTNEELMQKTKQKCSSYFEQGPKFHRGQKPKINGRELKVVFLEPFYVPFRTNTNPRRKNENAKQHVILFW